MKNSKISTMMIRAYLNNLLGNYRSIKISVDMINKSINEQERLIQLSLEELDGIEKWMEWSIIATNWYIRRSFETIIECAKSIWVAESGVRRAIKEGYKCKGWSISKSN